MVRALRIHMLVVVVAVLTDRDARGLQRLREKRAGWVLIVSALMTPESSDPH